MIDFGWQLTDEYNPYVFIGLGYRTRNAKVVYRSFDPNVSLLVYPDTLRHLLIMPDEARIVYCQMLLNGELHE